MSQDTIKQGQQGYDWGFRRILSNLENNHQTRAHIMPAPTVIVKRKSFYVSVTTHFILLSGNTKLFSLAISIYQTVYVIHNISRTPFEILRISGKNINC